MKLNMRNTNKEGLSNLLDNSASVNEIVGEQEEMMFEKARGISEDHFGDMFDGDNNEGA